MSPDDLGTPEDQLTDLLAAYDEALAAGLVPGLESDLASNVDPGSLDRLREHQVVVEMLERVWPRHGSGPDTVEQITSRTTVVSAPPPELGRFRIVRELGRGGFGVVYLATDPLLRRQVALKVPRPEVLFTPELRQRFLRESRAAAGLSHPNIVPVFDSGEVGVLCYFVSAYCPGGTLAAYLRGRSQPLPTRDAAALVAVLADAVQHAHARGILHRDLKPGNVLLECAPDAVPAAGNLGAVLRLADFGLAKFLDEDASGPNAPSSGRYPLAAPAQTGAGAVLGTPVYMAPEQAACWPDLVGPATDVHGLGVILYELLTGRPPFQDKTRESILQRVIAEPPPPLRSLRRGVPPDLEAICLKCLEKRPSKRYATAAALAEDLHRFLAGKPVHARPVGAAERAWRWARRRPAAAALLGVMALAAFAAVAAGAWHDALLQTKNSELRTAADDANHQRTVAEARGLQARRESYATRVRLACEWWEGGRPDPMAELLDGLRPRHGEEDLRGFEWYALWQLAQNKRSFGGHRGPVRAIALSPDGRLCATGGWDRTVRLWDQASGQLCATLEGHRGGVGAVAFSPDGKRLVSGSGEADQGEVALWDLAPRRRLAVRQVYGLSDGAVAFSPNGRTVAIGRVVRDRSGGLELWDTATGRVRPLLTTPYGVTGVRFSPDGRVLAVAYHDGSHAPAELAIRLLDPVSGTRRADLRGHTDVICGLDFSPDGRTLASASRDGTARLWDVAGGKERAVIQRGPAQVWPVAFSPDGRAVATADLTEATHTSVVRLWDTTTGALRGKPIEPRSQVHALAFTPDGGTIALACADGLVSLCRVTPQPEFVRLPGHAREAWAVAFAPDGRRLVSTSDDHTAKLWDPFTGKERATLHGHEALVSCVGFSPDGKLVATGSYDYTVRVWGAESGEPRRTLTGHTDCLRAVVFAPDGRTLASAGGNGEVKLWDLAAGRVRLTFVGHTDRVRSLAFTPDGRTLITAGEDCSVRAWEVATGKQTLLLQDTSEFWSLTLAPGGQLLAAGDKNGLIQLWDLSTGQAGLTLRGHAGGVRALAFAPDGRTLASGGPDRTVRLWQSATGHELVCTRGLSHEVNSVAFSSDGRFLAAALHDGSINLWPAAGESDPPARK